MASFLRWYNVQLKTRPLITNSVSATMLFGLGDVLAQQAVATSDSSHDWRRTARACTYGGVVFSPLISKWWYPLLNRVHGSTAFLTALKRMAMDQLIFAPVFSVPLYYTCMGTMEGKSFAEVKQSLIRNYFPTLFANWSVWPAFQFVNFMFIPPEWRFMAVNIVSTTWNAFLSHNNHKSNHAMNTQEQINEE